MSLKYEVIRKRRGIRYKRHGQTHRMDRPAIIIDVGDVVWYQYGEPLRYGYSQ